MDEQQAVPRLPFTAEVRLADAFMSSAASLEVRGANPGEPLEGARRALADFAAGADLGMFCGVRWPPQTSVGEWLPAPPADPGRIRGRLSLSGVDVGAWRILFHLLCRVHQSGPPLAVVRLTADATVGPPLDVSALLARPFPGRIGGLPFRLLAQPVPDRKHPVVRITFARALSDEEFERVAEALQVWGRVVSTGGYLESWQPPEIGPMVMSEVYPLGPKTVEATTLVFASAPEAFDGLVNLTARLHATLRPIVSLEIRG